MDRFDSDQQASGRLGRGESEKFRESNLLKTPEKSNCHRLSDSVESLRVKFFTTPMILKTFTCVIITMTIIIIA